MTTSRILILASCIFLCNMLLFADHIPEELMASGKPETKLAGIDLTRSKLKDVVRMYGQPQRDVKAPNKPAWIGHIWEFPEGKLELDVTNGRIDAIYVEGKASGPILRWNLVSYFVLNGWLNFMATVGGKN